jgi:hypothetical protein
VDDRNRYDPIKSLAWKNCALPNGDPGTIIVSAGRIDMKFLRKRPVLQNWSERNA